MAAHGGPSGRETASLVKRVLRYVRHDLSEIVFPASIDDGARAREPREQFSISRAVKVRTRVCLSETLVVRVCVSVAGDGKTIVREDVNVLIRILVMFVRHTVPRVTRTAQSI